MPSYRPRGVTTAATAINTSMKVLKKDMSKTLLHASSVEAESVRRNKGHNEPCRYRPMTDLGQVSEPFPLLSRWELYHETAVCVTAIDRGRSKPRRMTGKRTGIRN